MDQQNTSDYPFMQGSKSRYIPEPNLSSWRNTASTTSAPLYGTDMILTYSDQSTNSTRSSHSDATSPSTSSENTSMSSLDGQLSGFGYDPGYSFGYSPSYLTTLSNYGTLGQTYSAGPPHYECGQRATPSTLGWAKGYVPAELYTLVVSKGKEPYLRLQSHYHATAETPEKVYLDPLR
jgi:hypothetical protein